ncbi:hypothetical protein JIN85_03560 [Luteolibacter pohnpeiensis]|uniref:Uncharacterized protein n=1 Tax=Luteolibacter pohnpeiensis TaxID=454153 RepID=A0A934S364_9BACT|nr:hypothetical protein [Luteolibacter pohnpeiensis]MBK1881477.1 hypothetical protein [Luteolibacter pohnpeiensis]
MSAKKKSNLKNPQQPARKGEIGYKGIYLKPSSTDYATFARTTALAMGKSEPTGSALKPNKLLLSLLNLES